MANIQHSALTGVNVHAITAFSFATTVARDAASVVSGDIGKVAIVTADNSFYVLTSVGPNVWSPFTGQLAAVATSGAYGDLSGTPTLATVATSGSYADLSNKPTAASLGAVATSTLGAANGTATLGADGKLTTGQIPSAIVGGMNYQGVWDASTNTPTLVNGTGTKGYYYKVSVAGTTNIDGFANWTVGDAIVFDGTTWDVIQGGTSDVSSVAGRIGAVTLAQADISGLTTASTPTFAGVNATTFTGDLTGNAATATKLITARNINGVAFDGTADITISASAAAGTLTGTTLAANVVSSSLTSVGTLTSLAVSGAATVGGLDVGTKIMPQNSKSTDYTAVLGDSGQHIFHPSADTTARTFTIPANSSVAYPVGTAITFVVQNGAGTVTIAITTDTMRLAGAGTTGSRTLTANGVATALKIATTEWIISGTNLS